MAANVWGAGGEEGRDGKRWRTKILWVHLMRTPVSWEEPSGCREGKGKHTAVAGGAYTRGLV